MEVNKAIALWAKRRKICTEGQSPDSMTESPPDIDDLIVDQREKLCLTLHETTSSERFEDAEPEWTAEQEILLLHSMLDHKPVGFDRHIHMIFIQQRFKNKWRHQEPYCVTARMLWNKLESMHNLEALGYENQMPMELLKNVDFALPEEWDYLKDEYVVTDLLEPTEDRPLTRTFKGGKKAPKLSSRVSQLNKCQKNDQLEAEAEARAAVHD